MMCIEIILKGVMHSKQVQFENQYNDHLPIVMKKQADRLYTVNKSFISEHI